MTNKPPGDASSGVGRPFSRRAIMTGVALAAAPIGLKLTGARESLSGPKAEAATVPAQPIDSGAEILRVGPGKEYASITAAGERLMRKWNLKNPSHGAVHIIISPAEPGYYVNDSDTYSRRWPKGNHGGWPPYHGQLSGPAIIEGEPGKPAPDLVTDGYGDGVLYYQKGLFITSDYDTTFRHLNFAGFRRKDGYGNYAAVRIETLPHGGSRTGHMLFEDVRISACDDGILGGSPGQTVTLRRCEFTQNGGGAGRTHNVYIGTVDLLTVEDTLSSRSIIGHLLKSRAARTVIRNTRLLTGDGTTSACLDVPDGGALDIDGLICQKGPNSDASWIIHYSGENQDASGAGFWPGSSIKIRNLTMIAPRTLTRHPGWGIVGFANQSGEGEAHSGKGSHLVTPDAEGVRVFDLTPKQAGLPGVTILSAAPALDWSSPVSA